MWYRRLTLPVLERHVQEQITKTLLELAEASKSTKARPLKEYQELGIMYEAYLNSVYSLFEIISHLVRLFYPKKNLPWGFSNQKKRFLSDLELDKGYSEILKKTEWYDLVNKTRAEMVHFLSGMVTVKDKDDLGYLISNPQNKRKGTPERISVNSIKENVKETQTNIHQFLEEFADHFLEFVDQDSRASFVCLSSSEEVMGSESISLREYSSKEHGFCEFGWQHCPDVYLCKAKKPQVRA